MKLNLIWIDLEWSCGVASGLFGAYIKEYRINKLKLFFIVVCTTWLLRLLFGCLMGIFVLFSIMYQTLNFMHGEFLKSLKR
jgi:steroid 5-alpha reductase family enzyme